MLIQLERKASKKMKAVEGTGPIRSAKPKSDQSPKTTKENRKSKSTPSQEESRSLAWDRSDMAGEIREGGFLTPNPQIRKKLFSKPDEEDSDTPPLTIIGEQDVRDILFSEHLDLSTEIITEPSGPCTLCELDASKCSCDPLIVSMVQKAKEATPSGVDQTDEN